MRNPSVQCGRSSRKMMARNLASKCAELWRVRYTGIPASMEFHEPADLLRRERDGFVIAEWRVGCHQCWRSQGESRGDREGPAFVPRRRRRRQAGVLNAEWARRGYRACRRRSGWRKRCAISARRGCLPGKLPRLIRGVWRGFPQCRWGKVSCAELRKTFSEAEENL